MDRETGRSKVRYKLMVDSNYNTEFLSILIVLLCSSQGFGFVSFADEASAQAALDALNGTDMAGRQIRVSFAQPQGSRPSM